MEQTEIWLPVVGYEGMYEVSNQGNVKSNLRKQGNLRLVVESKGYHRVSLSKNGVVKKHFVHRLVGYAFLSLTREMHIDHKNGNRTDNRSINLRPCSLEDNLRFNNVKKKKTSQFVGVSVGRGGVWVAQIQVAKKKKTIGRYKSEIEAHEAYQAALKSIAA